MATSAELPSFDAIVKAERLRKKNEDLAAEIFGRKTKSNALPRGRKSDAVPSLASRIGISKPAQRSQSLTPKARPVIDSPRARNFHVSNNGRPSPFSPAALNKIAARQNQNGHSDITATVDITKEDEAPSLPRAELSIKGTAAPVGPFTVIGSNFAPGTTAADIEAALMSTGGEMVNCKILTASPTVMAEMVFAEKANADKVVETFNNRKADGRLLHVYIRNDSGTIKISDPVKSPSPAPVVAAEKPPEVAQPEPAYSSQREDANRQRRNAEPTYQDGRYGFSQRGDAMDIDMDDRRNDERHVYDRRIDDRRSAWRDSGRYGGRGDGYQYRGSGGRPLYSDDLYHRGRGRGYR